MDSSLTGMYGEAIVLTCLLSWGYPSTLVSGPLSYDLVVDIDGDSYKVQVKATDREYAHGNFENSFSFNVSKGGRRYTPESYDILACVSLPYNRVLFLPFTRKLRIRRKVSTFTLKNEKKSWRKCLKCLKKTR